MKVLLLCALLIAGCGHRSDAPKVKVTPQATPVTTPEPSGTEKVALLRKLAKTENLHWNVFCVPNEDGTVEYYQADAFENGTVDYGVNGTYYEDGVRDWWSVTGSTPENAAYALYQSIQTAPNEKVDRRPVPPIKKGNCDYQDVLTSDTKQNTPCKGSK